MITVKDIDEFMSSWADPKYSESWDNDGIMFCGNLSYEVKKLLICLDINEKTVKDAEDFKADLIITHHPFIFNALKRIQDRNWQYISRLVESGISVLSYHTRLDAAPGGVNDVLAEKIGLSDTRSFGGEKGIGRVGKLAAPMKAQDFSELLKNVLGCGTMRCFMNEKMISEVSVIGGGGKDFIFEAAHISDAYVTADLSHNSFITASELGISIFDAGHYHTENPVVSRVAEKIKEEFPHIAVKIGDSGCPFVLN